MDSLRAGLVAFGICCLMAHVPVVLGCLSRRRSGHRPAIWKKCWEASDYVVLLLALVGLVGATTEVRKAFALSELRDDMRLLLPDPSSTSDTMAKLAGTDQWAHLAEANRRGYEHHQAARIALDQQAFEKAGRELEAERDAYSAFLSTSPATPDAQAVQGEEVVFRARMADRMAAAEKSIAIFHRVSRTPAERAITEMSPLLLAAGLAVRTAKVTAKLLSLC